MEAGTPVVIPVDGLEVATTEVATTEVVTMVDGKEVVTTVVGMEAATTEVAAMVDGMEVATTVVGMEVATAVDGTEVATTVAGMVAVRAAAAAGVAATKTLLPANGDLATILAGDMEFRARHVACAHGQAVARPSCMRLEITAAIMARRQPMSIATRFVRSSVISKGGTNLAATKRMTLSA